MLTDDQIDQFRRLDECGGLTAEHACILLSELVSMSVDRRLWDEMDTSITRAQKIITEQHDTIKQLRTNLSAATAECMAWRALQKYRDKKNRLLGQRTNEDFEPLKRCRNAAAETDARAKEQQEDER